MSRRASDNSNLISLVIIGVIVIAIFSFAVTALNKKKDPFGKLPDLPTNEAAMNGNSLRGNNYKITGKIEERWVKSNFEGVHLSIVGEGDSKPVFIKIPTDLKRPNLERERTYSFSVEVGTGGIIEATGIKRL